MALLRPTRIYALKRGSGPTDITGVTEVRFNVRRDISYGFSASDWTYSSADVNGYTITGSAMFQDFTQAETLEDLAPEALIIHYQQSGSATVRTRTFDSIKWGSISELGMPEGGTTGPVVRFSISFTALFAPADDTFDDITAVGDAA